MKPQHLLFSIVILFWLSIVSNEVKGIANGTHSGTGAVDNTQDYPLQAASPDVTISSENSSSSAISSGSIYKITSKASGKVLDVLNSEMSDNANVCIWTDTDSDAQRWRLTAVSDNQFTLTNVASGKLLHMNGTTPENQLNINQYKNTNDATVLWQIAENTDGTFSIKCASDSNFALSVAGTETIDGSNVELSESAGGDRESWFFEEQDAREAAPTPEIADKIFAAWKEKYYDARTGDEIIPNEGYWGVAEMMEIVVDAYEVTGNLKYATMFSEMYNQVLTKYGHDWMWNDFNDDITWMVLACVRAGIILNNQTYINKAKDQFDKMYDRAIHANGSWLTWKMGVPGTNSCINGPAMVACCYLAQATNNNAYYTKAIKLYDWSKNNLFVPETGEVYDSYNSNGDGATNYWSSTYNQGTYLGASVMLYNYTKDPTYLKIADRIARYTEENMFRSSVIWYEEGPDLDGFKGILMRYARKYVVDCNRPNFIPWLQLNAKVAYNNRNSENIISTIWSKRAEETVEYRGFNASTAVSLMINCPYKTTTVKDAYSKIESEDFDYLKGIMIVQPTPDDETSHLGGIQNEYHTAYYNVDFGTTGAVAAEFRISSLASGNSIEIRLGAPNGELIGTATTDNTGNWSTYTTITCPVENVKGVQNIYLVYKGTGYICNINNFKFIEAESPISDTNGLIGQYFDGMNFETQLLERIDPNVNFNWEELYPAAEVPADYFSVRWTGKIEPLYSGEYTFYITSDNGRRVWINNELIIDKWLNDYDVTYSGKITLNAGERYDIKVEFFDDIGGANVVLEWESSQQQREVVPGSQLFLHAKNQATAISGLIEQAEDDILVFPNPATSFIRIEPNNQQIIRTSIIDVKGQTIYSNNKKYDDQLTIDVANLPKGLYLISFVTKTNSRIVRKFIK
ncbi:glycoside hydrolase family 76 protein [Maribellus sediminis]|uniref:glycoside hydrolase family 76 protein n=1 Tax=Maribellus sediminis TaxID=2696285 RepID=UPI00142FEDC0|nr:glycoside hydrolase family 76 protein [Maribellus sediminis]